MNNLSAWRPAPVEPLGNCRDTLQGTENAERRPFRRKTALQAVPDVPVQAVSLQDSATATLPSVLPVVSAAPTMTALARHYAPPLIGEGWQSLRRVAPMSRRHFLSGVPLVDFFRADPASRAIDLLRTRLLQTLRSTGWNRIAIVAPTQGCGATFTAVNLALSLARIPGSRNVLIDLNHRSPGVAGAMGLTAMGDMRGFLRGHVPMHEHLVRTSDTLAVGVTAGPDQDAAELLHNARCTDTLDWMNVALNPDVVLYDLPPILEYDDLTAFLPQVDGVLMVADATRSLAGDITKCEQILKGQTQVLGVILNRARRSEGKDHDA